jgi:predicted PurR-regulated permease PerM
MSNLSGNNSSLYNFERIVDIIIRLAIIFLLVGWCLDILNPFILILIWGAVIAIAIYPLQMGMAKMFGGRKTLAAIILTILFVCVLLVPGIVVMDSIIDGIKKIRELYSEGKLVVPAPGDRVANWPSFAKPIADLWLLASQNLEEAVMKYSDHLTSFGKWMLGAFAGIGKGLLQFVVSIIIAGIMLIYSSELTASAKKIFRNLAGDYGDQYTAIVVGTVRNVVKGILGVAVIQAAMAGLGFFIAGVPFAGIWTVLCLILAIVQVGVGPIAIPIAIYMFSVTDTLTASLLAGWLVITLISDNVLKPILLGRGAPAPMLVIFMGAIGGFIFNGFLGLFLGAVILTIGYKLLITWMNKDVVTD